MKFVTTLCAMYRYKSFLFVVKLRHAICTDDDESMVVKTYFALRQRTEVLHDYKFVAVAQT